MSEAACKTILCSGGARAAIQSYIINAAFDGTPRQAARDLELASNAAVWELQNAIEVTHLLVEQKFKIRREDAYDLIEAMEVIEDELAGKPIESAITLLSDSAKELHAGILKLHLAVTGESADYGSH